MIQAQDNQRISVDLREETLESVLWYLQNRTKFIFMYATEDIANITDISVRAKDKDVYKRQNKSRLFMSKMRFFALQELSNRKPLEVTAPSNKLSDYYGSHVFDRKKMQE